MRYAAVRLHAVLTDVDANLAACESAVEKAAGDGAQIVVLLEFFTTGLAYRLEIADAARPMDGPDTDAMTGWAARHGLLISGSLLIRDEDEHIRNAQLFITGPGHRRSSRQGPADDVGERVVHRRP